MTKYYAVGGVIDVLGKITWDGFGIHDEKITNKFLNQALYKNLNRKDKYRRKYRNKHEDESVKAIALFTNKEDAILFAETFKQLDSVEIVLLRAPVFEIEYDEPLTFKTSSLREIDPDDHYVESRVFDDDRHFPLLKDKYKHQVESCVIKNPKKLHDDQELPDDQAKNPTLEDFSKKAKIKDSYLPGYHNLDNNKYYTRDLVGKINRDFFDIETALVFGLTFWTIIIPAVYSIYRIVSKKNAKTIFSTAKDYHDYSPLWKEHDKERLIQLGYSFESKKDVATSDVRKHKPKEAEFKKDETNTGRFFLDEHYGISQRSNSTDSSLKEAEPGISAIAQRKKSS